MTTHFNIIKYLKIARYILESVKLKKKDGSKRRWEKYKKVFNGSIFLVIRFCLAVQAEAVEKCFKIHKK